MVPARFKEPLHSWQPRSESPKGNSLVGDRGWDMSDREEGEVDPREIRYERRDD